MPLEFSGQLMILEIVIRDSVNHALRASIADPLKGKATILPALKLEPLSNPRRWMLSFRMQASMSVVLWRLKGSRQVRQNAGAATVSVYKTRGGKLFSNHKMFIWDTAATAHPESKT